ncbi:MAG: RNA polymerase sigma factor [Patescibacteria group bacterium]|nr:RNA polymerase sigma factor [Patescibacteria group bacterium]MDE2437938.1 RNA polymerase sigma factor [Patescibacteria group bacterium]
MAISEENLSDEELVARVQGNNEMAFGVLMKRYQDRLLRYGRRFLAEHSHIEDIVQDIFIRAYQNIQSFDTSKRFSPWLYRIAHNAFVNALRTRQHTPLLFMNFDTLLSHPTYEEKLENKEEAQHMNAMLESGLNTIPAIYREVLILFYGEELRYQEIADILHIPIGTVGIRLRRGKELLKKLLHSATHYNTH